MGKINELIEAATDRISEKELNAPIRASLRYMELALAIRVCFAERF